VRLFVALALYEACDPAALDDPAEIGRWLDLAVRAGGFTELDRSIVRFEPQGATAVAVVGESHLALHSWPEEGRLFFDVVSCKDRESVERAVEALTLAVAPGRLTVLDERLIASPAARPDASARSPDRAEG
jgi:S-adenosylmethionine decarboxylase